MTGACIGPGAPAGALPCRLGVCAGLYGAVRCGAVRCGAARCGAVQCVCVCVCVSVSVCVCVCVICVKACAFSSLLRARAHARSGALCCLAGRRGQGRPPAAGAVVRGHLCIEPAPAAGTARRGPLPVDGEREGGDRQPWPRVGRLGWAQFACVCVRARDCV